MKDDMQVCMRHRNHLLFFEKCCKTLQWCSSMQYHVIWYTAHYIVIQRSESVGSLGGGLTETGDKTASFRQNFKPCKTYSSIAPD